MDALFPLFILNSNRSDEAASDDSSVPRSVDVMEKEDRPKSANELIPYYTPVRLRNNTYDQSRVIQLKDKFSNRTYAINEVPAGESFKAQSSSTRPVSSPIPPPKPPRTFAHDAYVQEKEHLKALVEKKYRQVPITSDPFDTRYRSKSVETPESFSFIPNTSRKQSNPVSLRKNFAQGVQNSLKNVKGSSSANGSAIKGIGSRIRAIKSKLVKNAFK